MTEEEQRISEESYILFQERMALPGCAVELTEEELEQLREEGLLSKKGIDAWNDRVDEVIGGGTPFIDEDYNHTHTIPSGAEIDEILIEYES